jgi:aminomethyltransferase
LCLYGHDIDETTTPIQAGLTWAIQKARRENGTRAGGFPGANVILGQMVSGVANTRVGLIPQTRAPMREGVELFETETDTAPIGYVTSGGFGPSVGSPVAMGYVPTEMSKPNTVLFGEVRGKRMPVQVSRLPHVPARFKR